MEKPEFFKRDRFYSYILPGSLLLWLALVMSIGWWLGWG